MPESAFLVVKRFARLYTSFAADHRFDKEIYALPLAGTTPERLTVRYLGLDRDPLSAFDKGPALAAEVRMFELEELARCDGSFLFHQDDLAEVLSWAEEEAPGLYEPVWARLARSHQQPPLGYTGVGFEPSFFPFGHFSAVCDCMCFPRWHGTDPEGRLFSHFFVALNEHGLFPHSDLARLFLRHYLSHEWTERGEFEIAEVFVKTGSA